jgi:hypothetical protein
MPRTASGGRLGAVARFLVVPVVLALGLAACASGAGGGAGPTGGPDRSAMPSSVPSVGSVAVSSPEDAAARVIATDPRFAGATMLQPGSIGLSKWWVATALDNGGYEVSVTLGWGDCPAGCINHHTWVYDVAADGTVAAKSDSGDPVPVSS